jgi:hypothetical protein
VSGGVRGCQGVSGGVLVAGMAQVELGSGRVYSPALWASSAAAAACSLAAAAAASACTTARVRGVTPPRRARHILGLLASSSYAYCTLVA